MKNIAKIITIGLLIITGVVNGMHTSRLPEDLGTKSLTLWAEANGVLPSTITESDPLCPVCLANSTELAEARSEIVKLPCKHILCSTCAATNNPSLCPCCRAPYTLPRSTKQKLLDFFMRPLVTTLNHFLPTSIDGLENAPERFFS